MSRKNLYARLLALSLWTQDIYNIANSRDRNSVIHIPKRKKKKGYQKKRK